MSQINFQEIIRQQQKQMVVMQVQIQALLAAAGGAGGERGGTGSNMGAHIEVAKPAIFNGEAGRAGGFITALSGAVHTGVEVCRMDMKMSGLVERPWLQLMCCAVCLPCGRNFR